jgi:hypothetical protein
MNIACHLQAVINENFKAYNSSSFYLMFSLKYLLIIKAYYFSVSNNLG